MDQNVTNPPLEAGPVLRALREVVAEAGRDHQYHGKGYAPNSTQVPRECNYVTAGKPDCIVARTLFRLGVPIAVLDQWEGISAWGMCEANHVAGYPTPLLTDNAASILDRAQGMQDRNHPWGSCLDAAEDRARELEVTA